MPDVKYQNDEQFIYLAGEPIQDRNNHPELVPAGSYPRLVGVDGRYSGSFRRFPGFKEVVDISDSGSITQQDNRCAPVLPEVFGGIDKIYFFKYVEVRTNPYIDLVTEQPEGRNPSLTLRGWVVGHTYTDTKQAGTNPTRGAIRFIYWWPAQPQYTTTGGVADPQPGEWQSMTLLQETWDAQNQFVISGRFRCSTMIDTKPVIVEPGAAGPSTTSLASEMESQTHAWDGFENYPVFDDDVQIDAAAMGPFLYLTVHRATPYGHEYDTQDYGFMPVDSYRKSFYFQTKNVATTGGGYNPNTTHAYYLWVATTDLGPLQPPAPTRTDNSGGFHADNREETHNSGGSLHAGSDVSTGFRIYSKFKNVYSPLVGVNTSSVSSGGSSDSNRLYWNQPLSIDYWSWLYGGKTGTPVSGAPGSEACASIVDRGLHDPWMWPVFKKYRSFESYWFEVADASFVSEGLIGGTLYQEQDARAGLWREDKFLYLNPTTGSTEEVGYGYDPVGAGGTYQGKDFKYSQFRYSLGDNPNTDFVLATSPNRIQPLLDDMAMPPKMISLLQPYQNTLLRVGGFPQQAEATNTANGGESNRETSPTIERDSVLSWGSLTEYAPEQFRITDSTTLGSGQDEKILSLTTAGDFAFAVGDTGIYRIVRNGNLLGINTVQNMAGGVGRYSNIGVGNTLYFVTKTGLWAVDGPSGQTQIISAMDRVITDEWLTTLSDIRMCYDQRLGCMFMYNSNSSVQEAHLMWNNGMITSLKDMNFSHCTQGIDPETAGNHRSFWITSDGRIMTPNADREGAFTMATNATSEDLVWNGTVKDTTPTDSTFEVDQAGGIFDPDAVGYKLYMLSGNLEGESSTISVVNSPSGWVTVSPAFSAAPDVGSRFSIAPIPFEIVGWPLQGARGRIHPFRSKLVSSMAHNVVLRGGESTSANPNLKMIHGIARRDDPDTLMLSNVDAEMNADPSKNYTRVNYRGPTLMPVWKQLSSNLDFELIAGLVDGKITASEAETSQSAN
jgi:hypothetical protein